MEIGAGGLGTKHSMVKSVPVKIVEDGSTSSEVTLGASVCVCVCVCVCVKRWKVSRCMCYVCSTH